MAEYKGFAYLKNKLAMKKYRVITRYKYYEMKNLAMDLGISTPPELRWLMGTLGWCGHAVDALGDRLVFREFKNDVYNFTTIFNDNNKDVLTDSAINAALIGSCSFIYITQDENGYPRLRVIDARHATGIIDPITNMLKEGYAVLEFDDCDQPLVEAYFIPGMTSIIEKGKVVNMIRNDAPYPLLVPVINRPDAVRPFGHSRISRACMCIMDSAIRTVKRSEIASEFFSYPQKYVLGMEDSAEEMDKWQATMSAMLRIDKDSQGDRPVVGQFQTASMTPHADMLRMYAGLFAGETGLTLDDLGFPSQNPSSAEAIKASHETLRLAARKAQRDIGTGLLNAGYLASCIRDGRPYRRQELAAVVPVWDPIFEPDNSTLTVIGDAIAKINNAVPGFIDRETLRDLTGIEGAAQYQADVVTPESIDRALGLSEVE